MCQKFAFIYQNKNHSLNKTNQKLNINATKLKKVSPHYFIKPQAKYDTISVIYAKEIDAVAEFFSKNNNINFFAKENFSKLFEDFKEKFKKFNLNLNFYQVKNLNEIITNISNFNCGAAFFDILNDKNDILLLSEFLDSQNIQAINFSNCNTILSSKMSINVDFKKNILNSLTFEEKLKIFLDCVYLNLQTKKTLNFNLNFKLKT